MSARPLVLTLLTAALALPTLAAAAPVGTTQLVDRPSGLGALPFDGAGNAQIGAHAVSADGRFVVFTSQSDSLVAGDEDSAQGIYRLDRVGGRVEQVDHGGPWDLATEPSISADGTAVAFVSLGRLSGEDVDSGPDAYLRTGIGSAAERSVLVSFAAGQAVGGDVAGELAVSADGRMLAWGNGSGVFFSRVIGGTSVAPGTRADVPGSGGRSRLPAFAPARRRRASTS